MLTFMSYVGISMPAPLFAPIFLTNKSYALSGNHSLNIVLLGVLLAAYPLGQLLGSPLTGYLADKFCKKKILLFMLMGAALSYLLSGITFSFFDTKLLIFFRLLTGFFESHIVIIQSLISQFDGSCFNKTRRFSVFYSMCTLGFIIGPFFGGMGGFAALGPAAPFWIIALLVLISLMLVAVKLDSPAVFPNVCTKPANPSELGRYFLFFFISFCCYFGMDSFLSLSPVYLVLKWKLQTQTLVFFSVFLALALSTSQYFFVASITQRFSARMSLFLSMASLSLLLFLITRPFVGLICFFSLLPFLALSISIITNMLPVLISNEIPPSKQGKAFGILRASRALGDVIVCLLGGFLTSLFLPLSLIASAFIVLLALFLLFFKMNLKERS